MGYIQRILGSIVKPVLNRGGAKPAITAWNLQVVKPFISIAESQRADKSKPWMVTHFKITNAAGGVEEVKSTDILLKLVHPKTKEVVEVHRFAVNHIISLHLSGKEAGSVMAAASIEESLNIVARHLPERIPFKGDSAPIELDIQQNTGTEGVTHRSEMLQKGVVSYSALLILESARKDVFQLNLKGNDEEKKAFVENFNAKLAGLNIAGVKLGIRGGAITPFYSTERQPTNKLFVVIGKEKDDDGSIHNRVWTLTPGRFMDKLPSDVTFTGKFPPKGIPEGTTVAQLIEKKNRGGHLTPVELSLIKSQAKAQDCWWQGGFIDPPNK